MDRSLADRARDFLDIRRGLWVEDDAEAIGRARGVLGADEFLTRLDDSEREYERDQVGRFASAGGAADAAAEHAEVARAADRGSSSASARSRARKAAESAALARVAADDGDHAAAARHAADAERHAQAAVKHGGASEWTVRERVSAMREVERARATNDPEQMAKAHHEAARAFGVTTKAGREHVREATRHSVDARPVPGRTRVGESVVAGDDSRKPAPPPEPVRQETSAEALERRAREARASTRERDVAFGQQDDFGRRAAENARAMARDSVAKERKAELDRQVTARQVTAKAVSLPSASVVKLPGAGSRLMSSIRRALGRSDDLELTCESRARYDARMAIKLGISRDLLRHDQDCDGSEGCECEDDEDCDEDENLECGDDGECEDREDGADRLRLLMVRRYGPALVSVPAEELVRRAAIILGVSTAGHTQAGALATVTLRADAEWRDDEGGDREYDRDEGGRFASGGGGGGGGERERGATDRAAKATENAGGTARGHAEASRAHREAAGEHRLAVSEAQATRHEKAADAHEMAARSLKRAEEDRGKESARDHEKKAQSHAEQANFFSKEAKITAESTPEARAAAEKAADHAKFREKMGITPNADNYAGRSPGVDSVKPRGPRENAANGDLHRSASAASRIAEHESKLAARGDTESHNKAADRHVEAADRHREAGNAAAAREHDQKAAEHLNAGRRLNGLDPRGNVNTTNMGDSPANAAVARAAADRAASSARTPADKVVASAMADAAASAERRAGARRMPGVESHAAVQSGEAHHDHGRAHAERAAGHAERAKADASGTSASARSSARKAAESAALAKVAADHGDHAEARRHSANAERHATAASERAAAHRSSGSTRALGSKDFVTPMTRVPVSGASSGSESPRALGPRDLVTPMTKMSTKKR